MIRDRKVQFLSDKRPRRPIGKRSRSIRGINTLTHFAEEAVIEEASMHLNEFQYRVKKSIRGKRVLLLNVEGKEAGYS